MSLVFKQLVILWSKIHTESRCWSVCVWRAAWLLRMPVKAPGGTGSEERTGAVLDGGGLHHSDTETTADSSTESNCFKNDSNKMMWKNLTGSTKSDCPEFAECDWVFLIEPSSFIILKPNCMHTKTGPVSQRAVDAPLFSIRRREEMRADYRWKGNRMWIVMKWLKN